MGLNSIELPEAFVARMKKQLGKEYTAFEKTLSGKKERGLRVNRMKLPVSDYLRITLYSLERIPYAEDGFYFLHESKMGRDSGRYAGMYYLQDPSAMIPVNSVNIRTGWKALDLSVPPPVVKQVRSRT